MSGVVPPMSHMTLCYARKKLLLEILLLL